MSETSSRADLLYREAETGKRHMSGAQAIGILADVPIPNPSMILIPRDVSSS
jgi:hypothetical protein